ncbi:MAG: DUF371 domain-containing protein [Candidatus Methanofastidiosia archaeon]
MELTITARGHDNIRAAHKTTIEITKDPDVTLNGDCIVAVGADIGFCDMPDAFKKMMRESKVRATFSCAGREWSVDGEGTKKLAMLHKQEMVIRKSSFECARTLMINADKASCDMPDDIVSGMQDPKNVIKITLSIIGPRSNKHPHQNNHI